MVSKTGFFLTAGTVIIFGYFLQKTKDPKLDIPIASTRQHLLKDNLTLLGTNDLHSTVAGLGLKLYPDKIEGGYSKLVHMINSIRYVIFLSLAIASDS